jgi:hypothetical protein
MGGEDVETFDIFVQEAIINPSAFRAHPPQGTDPDLWEKYKKGISHVVKSFSHASLLEMGWLSASNAYNLGGSKEPTDAQLNVFFQQVLKCWKELRIRPKINIKQFTLSVGPQRRTNTYEDALEAYCSRKLQDAFYDYLLS